MTEMVSVFTIFSSRKMEQLQNFTLTDLYEKLRMDDNDFDRWLQELDVPHRKSTCPECGGKTTIRKIKDRRYGNWRCTTRTCRKETGYFGGTFLEGSHLPPKKKNLGNS